MSAVRDMLLQIQQEKTAQADRKAEAAKKKARKVYLERKEDREQMQAVADAFAEAAEKIVSATLNPPPPPPTEKPTAKKKKRRRNNKQPPPEIPAELFDFRPKPKKKNEK